MSTKLLKTCAHSFVFKPCSSAITFSKAPLLIAFAATFFIGAMVQQKTWVTKLKGKVGGAVDTV